MVFAEQKTETGFTYDCEDVFGTIHIESPKKLDAGILDDMTVVLLRIKGGAQTVQGNIETQEGLVSYTFTKRAPWEEDDEENNQEIPCENTHTSTSERASAYTAIAHRLANTFNWCRRFVEAFREAWKRGQPK